MLCTLPGLVHSPLHRRRIWRRLAASMRSAGCAHYLCGCGRIDYLEAEGYSCPQESEEYFLLRANEASLLLLDRLRLPPDQISVLLNSDDVGVREELLLTAFSRRSAWLLLRANDAQAAASLAEDFYYEQGIALVADAQLSIPSPCFIYSAGAHAWLGQSGAALRRVTVMYYPRPRLWSARPICRRFRCAPSLLAGEVAACELLDRQFCRHALSGDRQPPSAHPANYGFYASRPSGVRRAGISAQSANRIV